MANVTFDYSAAKKFIREDEVCYMKKTAEAAREELLANVSYLEFNTFQNIYTATPG